MGQIIPYINCIIIAGVGAVCVTFFGMLCVAYYYTLSESKRVEREPFYHRIPRPETIIRPALMYLIRSGQQIRILYGNEICYLMSKTEVRWVPRMRGLMWHDALIDATYPNRLKIVAISRDSCGLRRTMLMEYLPREIADLILCYIFLPIKGKRQQKMVSMSRMAI